MTEPPVAKILPQELTAHGETRIDNYYWMRDRSNPEVIAHLEAENAYADAMMEPTLELQKQLYREIIGRIKLDDTSVPLQMDDWFYYTRTEKERSYAIYCRKHRSVDAHEETLLDANLLAEGQKYFRLGTFTVSPDHKLLAYSTDVEGDESYTIRVKDLQTSALLPDVILNAHEDVVWAADNRTFFYTVLDEMKRPYRVMRHELGAAEDTLVYEEEDERFWLGLGKSRNRELIFIDSHSPLTSEVRWIRAAEPFAEFRPILARVPEVEYDVEHQGEWFYIRINEGAENFRLMRTPVANPSRENWEEIIPGRERITLEEVEGFADWLVITERNNGLQDIRIARANALDQFESIEFPEPVYTAHVVGNATYSTDVLRFTYSSLVTPPSVFDYNMVTKQRELKKQEEVVGGYDASAYQSERLFACAPDGVEVPISLVYRKGMQRNGRNPLLLYGYGAYGITSEPAFASDRLSLLDRGFIYAIAHIRGGGDSGKFWHDAGKLLTKRNTFSDFIACAEHLIAHGYTSPDRLAIRGGSAGGLLIGAVLNARPDLFHVVYTRVPFVDTLTTMLDPTLPLTITEYEEWGNPEEVEFYKYIRTYSPYDNVKPQSYPKILVTSGINDPRVSYWEPAKWVAKLRALKEDGNVVLLKMEMGAGHFGPSGRYAKIKETAFEYAFLLHHGGYLG